MPQTTFSHKKIERHFVFCLKGIYTQKTHKMDCETAIGSYIKKLREVMIEYQKEHDIKGECIQNTYLYCSILKELGVRCEMSAVIAIGESIDENDKIGGVSCVVHMISCVLDDMYIDTSYEIYKHQHKSYFDTIKEYMDEVNSIRSQYFKQHNKAMDKHGLASQDFVSSFLTFKKCADDINSGNSKIIKSDYYYEQEAFVKTEMMKYTVEYVMQRTLKQLSQKST